MLSSGLLLSSLIGLSLASVINPAHSHDERAGTSSATAHSHHASAHDHGHSHSVVAHHGGNSTLRREIFFEAPKPKSKAAAVRFNWYKKVFNETLTTLKIKHFENMPTKLICLKDTKPESGLVYATESLKESFRDPVGIDHEHMMASEVFIKHPCGDSKLPVYHAYLNYDSFVSVMYDAHSQTATFCLGSSYGSPKDTDGHLPCQMEFPPGNTYGDDSVDGTSGSAAAGTSGPSKPKEKRSAGLWDQSPIPIKPKKPVTAFEQSPIPVYSGHLTVAKRSSSRKAVLVTGNETTRKAKQQSYLYRQSPIPVHG